MHLVVREVNGLAHSLIHGLSGAVVVRTWRSLPRPGVVEGGTTVVVDLSDPAPAMNPKYLLPILSRVDLWLLFGTRLVEPAWLEIAKHPRVTIVGSQAVLVAELLKRVRGRASPDIAQLILDHVPHLRELEAEVRAVCSQPWRVRRPRDLASVAGASLRRLKCRCTAIGFTRIEHFIVCVRAIAVRQLIAQLGLTNSAARALVGCHDASNMRRHLDRALRRSPQAAHQLSLAR